MDKWTTIVIMIELITILLLLVIVWRLWSWTPVDCTSACLLFTQARFDGITITGDITEMILREGQKVTLTGQPKTRTGNAAAYETGTAVWESSDPSTYKVTVNPENELEADVECINGAGAPGLVSCTLDGDPDADQTRTLVGTLPVVAAVGEAFEFSLSASGVSDIVLEDKGTNGLGGEPVLPPPVVEEEADGETETEGEATDTETGGSGDANPNPEAGGEGSGGAKPAGDDFV